MKIESLKNNVGFSLNSTNEEEMKAALSFTEELVALFDGLKCPVFDHCIEVRCKQDQERRLSNILYAVWPQSGAPTDRTNNPATTEEKGNSFDEIPILKQQVSLLQNELAQARAQIKDFEESNNATQRRTMCLSVAMQQGHGFRFDLMSPTENDKKYDVFRVADMIEAHLFRSTPRE